MEYYHIKLIETAVVLILAVALKYFTRMALRKVSQQFQLASPRKKLIGKLINLLMALLAFIFILIIWGVDQKELAFYLSSLLAVMGIAFFAQWSLLSNITAGIILFFNHPVRIGDNITILDKEYNIDGVVTDIGLFFTYVKTQRDEKVTIPNSVLLQKMVIVNHHTS